MPVTVASAELDWAGQTAVTQSPQGLAVRLQGDARVQHVKLLAATEPGALGDELLSGRDLVVPGVNWQSTPGQVPSLGLGTVKLQDFYASLVVTPQEIGRAHV